MFQQSQNFLRCCLLLTLAITFVGCQKTTPTEKTTSEKTTSSESHPPKLAEGVLTEIEEGFDKISLAELEIFSNEMEAAQKTWSEDRGVLLCTGKPKGYLHTKKSYKNFVLKLDYRYEPSARHIKEKKLDYSNTGVLVYITGDHKQWPVSLEVQGKHMEMASIKANGGAADVVIADQPQQRDSARKPVGEWNSFEIESREGVLKAKLNDVLICQNEAGELNAGQIGFQSEGFEVHFRNIRIQELD